MKMMRMEIEYSDEDLNDAVREVLDGNELQRRHPHAHGRLRAGHRPRRHGPTGVYINPRRRPRVDEGSGLACCVSSWVRTSDNAIPIRLKSGSNYQNGRLATPAVEGQRLRPADLPQQARPRRRGHGRDAVHGAQGPPGDAAGDRRHPREHHAHDADGLHLPGALRHERGRARHRPHRALRGRRGVLLRQRLRDHADPLASTASSSATARSARSRRVCMRAYMDIVRGVDKRYPEWRTPTYRPVRV